MKKLEKLKYLYRIIKDCNAKLKERVSDNTRKHIVKRIILVNREMMRLTEDK